MQVEAYTLRAEFKRLIKNFNIEKADRCLEIIKWIGEDDSDDEVAHSMEKAFWEACLKSIEHPLAMKALQTQEFDFSRWYA